MNDNINKTEPAKFICTNCGEEINMEDVFHRMENGIYCDICWNSDEDMEESYEK